MADRLRTGEDIVPSGTSSTTIKCEDTSTTFVPPKHTDGLQKPALQPQLTHITERHAAFKNWILEVCSVVLAIVLIAAIISILAHFNGQTVPDWPLSINLNTLIALLATLSRALILLTVAEIIGQTKWSWFSRQPRPINALQRFDSASRGLIGSMSLLFTAPGSIFSLAGSLVVIVSLAMGPFAQQAIKTIDCEQYVPDANASVPVAHHVAGGDEFYRLGAGIWLVTVDLQGALVNALVNPGGNDSTVAPTCQTGNCTFSSDSTNITYSSIGLCSLSIDTTSFVSKVRVNNNDTISPRFNYTLPNGLHIIIDLSHSQRTQFMHVGKDDNDITWATSAFSDDFRDLAPLSIYKFTVLEFTKASCANATSCPHNVKPALERLGVWDYISVTSILYPCMRNYHAKVEKGTFQETVISTVPARENWPELRLTDASAPNVNYTALKTPCVIDDKEYSIQNNFSDVPRSPGRIFTPVAVNGVNYSAPDECLYKMDNIYGMAIAWFLEQTFLTGSCYQHDDMWIGTLWCPDNWWLEPFYHGGNATFDTLSAAVGNIATGATNKLRAIGSSNYEAGRHELASGTVMRTTVCTVFDWRWLLLPIILVAVTAVLLVLMVVQNSRNPEQPVWKSSLLPFIFYGVRGGSSSEDEVRPALGLAELDRQAGNVSGRWYGGGDAGFVTSESPPKKPPEQDTFDMDSLLGTD